MVDKLKHIAGFADFEGIATDPIHIISPGRHPPAGFFKDFEGASTKGTLQDSCPIRPDKTACRDERPDHAWRPNVQAFHRGPAPACASLVVIKGYKQFSSVCNHLRSVLHSLPESPGVMKNTPGVHDIEFT